VKTTTDEAEKEPKEKEKDATERTRRMSVAGWASSAVESVTGGRGTSKKNKDKDSFAALDDDDVHADQNGVEVPPGHKVRKSSSFRGLASRGSFKSKSKESLATQSPKPAPRILKPPSLQDRKVVKALYDFSGSSDELSFKAGEDIVVLNEVLDDWWMGQLPDGRQGLFPTSYTEPADGHSKTTLSNRPYQNGTPGYLQPILSPGLYNHDNDHDHYLTSDADDEQIIRAVPMAANKSPAFYGGFDDRASMADSMADEEDHRAPAPTKLFSAPPPVPSSRPFDDYDSDNWFATNAVNTPKSFSTPKGSLRSKTPTNILDPAQQPLIDRSQSAEPPMVHENGFATPTKKIPPPPPPRRATSHNPTGSGPPIPERRLPPSATASLNPSTASLSVAGNGQGYDRSPFDSAVELNGGEGDGKCTQFRQNPFQPKGMCSNCLEFHD
jgi:hypothetical protein